MFFKFIIVNIQVSRPLSRRLTDPVLHKPRPTFKRFFYNHSRSYFRVLHHKSFFKAFQIFFLNGILGCISHVDSKMFAGFFTESANECMSMPLIAVSMVHLDFERLQDNPLYVAFTISHYWVPATSDGIDPMI